MVFQPDIYSLPILKSRNHLVPESCLEIQPLCLSHPTSGYQDLAKRRNIRTPFTRKKIPSS